MRQTLHQAICCVQRQLWGKVRDKPGHCLLGLGYREIVARKGVAVTVTPRPESRCLSGLVLQQKQDTQADTAGQDTVISERVERPGIMLAEIAHQERSAQQRRNARRHRGDRRGQQNPLRHMRLQQMRHLQHRRPQDDRGGDQEGEMRRPKIRSA